MLYFRCSNVKQLLCAICIFTFVQHSSAQMRWDGILGFAIGQAQVRQVPELSKGNHRLQGISGGGIKAGIGQHKQLTEKPRVSAAVILLYQQLDLRYSLNSNTVFRQRIFPLTVEFPLHAQLDLVRPKNSISALFGVKYNQSLTDNSHPQLGIESNYWSFDIGLGKEFEAKRGTFQPSLIYSLGASNLMRYTNIENLQSNPEVLIYLHQISLQIQW